MSEMPSECECCSNTSALRLYMTMWMCQSCIDKNKELSAKSEAEAESRVKEVQEIGLQTIETNKILRGAVSIVTSVEVKTDIFNAETVALIDIYQAIQSDEAISDKHGKFEEVALLMYQKYKEKIFANQAENVELANKQNAIQKYLNTLRNKLTESERTKYKLQDLNYKPNNVKLANKGISSPAKPKKYDKADVIKAAQRAGVPVSVIQMLCVAKNMTPMQASDSLLAAGSKQLEQK